MSGPGDIGGEVSGDEAAWRDLVARFDVPTDRATTVVPWPASEDLPEAPSPPEPGSLDAQAPSGLAGATSTTADTSDRSADRSAPTADPGTRTPDASAAPDQATRSAAGFVIPIDRTRVIRPAGSPRSYTPAEETDEPYVPEPLPPPAKLDSTSKAALAGIIGGPGYLLVASIFMHWTISAEAALIAVAAFVAGFVTLIIKLGDRSNRDDDDDGAVL
ncbi:MAG TPA: hypothetical protein VLM11_00580 [Streptosporangiaceae bacterium]|nr:hypothetical protein [Streptosporangiaceae bacterium]